MKNRADVESDEQRERRNRIARMTKILCVYFVVWNDGRKWNDAMTSSNISLSSKCDDKANLI